MSTPLDYAEFYFGHVDKEREMTKPEGVAAPLEPTTRQEHQIIQCTSRYCGHHRDVWRHFEDNIANPGEKELREMAYTTALEDARDFWTQWVKAQKWEVKPAEKWEVFDWIIEFAEAYAAAVSKNIREERDAMRTDFNNKIVLWKLACDDVRQYSARILELEKEIAALRETK